MGLKTDSIPNNLPQELTSFVGRERELADIGRLLANAPLLTLTGAGGCGKTRLAIRAARKLLEDPSAGQGIHDGVWLVQLASLSDAALVPQIVASSLGVREESGQALLATITHYLHLKTLLLVLDNCEHLILACAQLAETLLQACPNLRILATSREPLNIAGETLFQVPSLAFPDPRYLPSLEITAQYESIRLFAERAQAVKPEFRLTEANAASVAQICSRLDGMPLAIELAAARLKVLSTQEIGARLDDRFNLLTGGSRTGLPRHQTLRATIDWSYNLLSETERKVLQRLCVFSGGWTLEAAEVVSAGGGVAASEVLDALSSLIEKSLVVLDKSEGSRARYHLLETIQQYAREKLDESGTTADTRDRHLDYFLDWAEAAEPYLIRQEQLVWLNQFEMEHDNLRAALEWGQISGNRGDSSLRLAAVVSVFWQLHGYHSEGCMRLSAALAQKSAQHPTASRAKALHRLSVLAFYQTDYAAVRTLAEASLAIWRKQGPAGRLGAANALEIAAEAASETGDFPNALPLYEEALVLYREVGHLVGVGDTVKMLGWSAMRTGDYDLAETKLQEALIVCRQAGDNRHIASALAGLGELAIRRAQYDRAAHLLEESLHLCQQLGDKWGLAIAFGSLGWLALRQRDFAEMRAMLRESLSVRMETGDKGGVAWCLEKLAEAAILQGGVASSASRVEEFQLAARVFGAAAALRAPLGSVIDPADKPEYERMISGLRTALGEEAFTSAWAEGQAMALEQAITEAQQLTSAPEPSQTAAAPEYPLGLTAREVEVLRLLAKGLTNRQIADQLVLSKRTVDAHLSSIYGKLNVTTRSAATRAAMEQKIV